MVGASIDRTIKVWNGATLKRSVPGHKNKVHCVKLNPTDGARTMVSGGTDQTIRVWDVNSGRELKMLRAPSTCNSLDVSTFDGSVVVSGHQDGAVRLWDLRNGEQVACTPPAYGQQGAGGGPVHTSQVTSTVFNPRGSMQILTASRDNTCRVIDSRTLEPLSSLPRAGLTHSALRIGYNWSRSAFSHDGRYAVAGSLNGVVLCWDVQGGGVSQPQEASSVVAAPGTCVAQLRTHSAAVTSCAWSPGVGGWQQVATCDKSGKLCLWD